MKDERTDEQKEADAALEQAVRRCADVYFTGGFVTEFAVVAHQFAPNSDGTDEVDNILLLLPNGGHDMPLYRLLGLLAAGRVHAEAEAVVEDP